MKFVLVNGRTPRARSFCALCCEPIGKTYLREIATRLSYCDHQCYLGHCKVAVQALQNLLRSGQEQGEFREFSTRVMGLL